MRNQNNTFAIVVAIALTSVMTSIITLTGMRYFSVGDVLNRPSANDSVSSAAKLQRQALNYVEVSDQIITLRGNGVRERYLLLDLALVTHGKEQMKAAESSLPKIKSTLVESFSGLDYNTVRAMPIEEIRRLILTNMEASFGKSTPFSDITISKMIFQ